VLLDAGAGNAWSYREKGTGDIYSRSEGLAIASLDMFKDGMFSGDPEQPYRVDGIPQFYLFQSIDADLAAYHGKPMASCV